MATPRRRGCGRHVRAQTVLDRAVIADSAWFSTSQGPGLGTKTREFLLVERYGLIIDIGGEMGS